MGATRTISLRYLEVKPQTAVGKKLAEGTDLIGHLFSDSTYTVINVEATEVKYLSMKGLAMKLFVMEVDLTKPNIAIVASMPNNKNEFGMQQMTAQAKAYDSDSTMVWWNQCRFLQHDHRRAAGDCLPEWHGSEDHFPGCGLHLFRDH